MNILVSHDEFNQWDMSELFGALQVSYLNAGNLVINPLSRFTVVPSVTFMVPYSSQWCFSLPADGFIVKYHRKLTVCRIMLAARLTYSGFV